MQRREQIRRNPTAAYVGTGLSVIGFGLILIAWNGAAEVAIADARFPFFMASGLIGLGLIVVGVALMVIETMRRDAEMRSIELGRLAASLAVLHGELGSDELHRPGADGSFRPEPRAPGTAVDTVPGTAAETDAETDADADADATVELGSLRAASRQRRR